MAQPVRRTYVDASVFGGAFDDEFSEDSRQFFEQAEAGRFKVLTSALVADEIAEAPPEVRDLFERHLSGAELVRTDEATLKLQAAYLSAGILSANWADDALHVALATVARGDLIVSWNFRHIVHVDKSPRYNEVNLRLGYRHLAIHTPSEVISYEDCEEI